MVKNAVAFHRDLKVYWSFQWQQVGIALRAYILSTSRRPKPSPSDSLLIFLSSHLSQPFDHVSALMGAILIPTAAVKMVPGTSWNPAEP